MKNRIKNVSEDYIRLFVMDEEVEKRVDIPPGHSMIVDNYETKTIKIFSRKGLITVEPAQLNASNSFALLGEEIVEGAAEYKKMTNIDSNSDEVMDDFHTTETKIVSITKDIETGITPARLDIVENEVEQYVEDGYVKGEWSDEDTAFLKKNYPKKGRTYCSTHLNRNETSVQKKINALGLKKKKKKK